MGADGREQNAEELARRLVYPNAIMIQDVGGTRRAEDEARERRLGQINDEGLVLAEVQRERDDAV